MRIVEILQDTNYKLTQFKDEYVEELDLLDFKPTTQNIAIKSFSESFGKSGRLDAEYYQPKYDEVEEKIKSKGFVLIKDICTHMNYGIVPRSPYVAKGVPYIKGLNLKNLSIDTDKLDFLENTENLKDKFYTKENDIIISQMGTVGNVGVVSKTQENWLFASFTIRIRN